MNKFELTQSLTNLANYYERKPPSPATVELWFEKVRTIPAEALQWIENQIESGNESFPRNVPGTIWACYKSWMEANPDKMSRRYEVSCPDGCDDGVVHVRKQKPFGGESLTYTYVFSCSKCNRGPQGYPHARLQDLLADGYEDEGVYLKGIHGAAYLKSPRYQKSGGVKAMVASIVESMTTEPQKSLLLLPISEATVQKFEKAGLSVPPIGGENSRYEGKVEFSGVETINEPSDEEILQCGQI